eukprot:TRINITY_DN7535_c0_g2_i1.p1 TRINITY_DN7535_c0_g2~~TRINITY_DN7535_c0_g2_i1.p1  ORF type:complete len:376 (+),score=84.72 TRINITY_DN7535_c0_g2_i1:64-1191(+)
MSRVRTESMIQRLSKKPLSEGFDLWDKDYILGALRLFQCKLDSAPPFEVAPCLESIAAILALFEEDDDAVEHYSMAGDKYSLIQKKLVSGMMQAKMTELSKDPQAALKLVGETIAQGDETSAKDKSQLGRLYSYKGELLSKIDNDSEALTAFEKAISLTPGRMEAGDLEYLTQYQLGLLHVKMNKPSEADAAFTACLKLKPTYFLAAEALIPLKKSSEDLEGAMIIIDTAYELHPKANLLREKAFLYSEMGKDDEGIKVCDDGIADPPHEETEALTGASGAVVTLCKAKAAIFADSGRLEDAKQALDVALAADPRDLESNRMSADVNTTLAREYLAGKGIPQFLDSLVNHVLQSKPEDPLSFMVEAIETDAVPLP